MRRVSSAGDVDCCLPSRVSGHAGESAETSAEIFPLQIGTFREMEATPRPRTLRRKSTKCRDFHLISTMRALYLREARLGVEIGPYLLGFSQWAGDGQNCRHTSNAPSPRPKKATLQALYGASRDRTGDLLLAKQALSQLSYGPATSQYTRYRADSRLSPSAGMRTFGVLESLMLPTAANLGSSESFTPELRLREHLPLDADTAVSFRPAGIAGGD